MDEKKERLREIEAAMAQPDFWVNKDIAQDLIKEMGEIKDEIAGAGKYDKGSAVLTLLAGAGGDDAEDFAAMLRGMYDKYCDRQGWEEMVLHKNVNDRGGYRNITIEISGKGVYGDLKNESGVHRLVRISPFNAKKLRHTSFVLVDVIPQIDTSIDVDIPETDLQVEFAKSSGPGGQNVNKRETAVRMVHKPTNISVHVESERSQAQNREKALQMIKGKLFKLKEEAVRQHKDELQLTKNTEVAWGSQIRSYVLHPYKMVKDHRTDVEVRDVNGVLEDGKLEEFIEAERELTP